MSCNGINGDTIKLLIDGTNIPLTVSSNTSSGIILVAKSPYIFEVDGNVGRTATMFVYGEGVTLAAPYMQGSPCYGLSWQNRIDNPLVCIFENPATIKVLPGGNYNSRGIIYQTAVIDPATGSVQCTLWVTMEVRRSLNCPIKCKEEVVDIPSTRLEALVNDIGHQYNLSGGYLFTECLTDSAANKAAAKAIKDLILAQMSCDDPGLIVTVDKNWNGDNNCVRVTIKNSPIRMHYLKAGGIYYPFSLVKC